MSSINKKTVPADPEETDDIIRKVLIWLNSYQDFPKGVGLIVPEPMLQEKQDGMELSVIQNGITNRYIYGGHKAEIQFAIFYRIYKPSGPDRRLKAMQALNQLGVYACSTIPDLGSGVNFIRCEVTSQAAFLAPDESGDEDYQILMNMTYEVI